MKKLLSILLFSFLLFVSNSCKKDSPEPNDPNPGINKEKLRQDSVFNNALLPGLGNVFYEKNLLPNTESQLVCLLKMNADTMAYYGKVNALGQLEYIHTAILSANNNQQLFVTEMFPDNFINRKYTITNGIKSRFVIETESYNASDKIINMLDYDWNTNTYKTIASVYVRNGQIVSEFQRDKNGEENRAWNCTGNQQSTGDFEKDLDNSLDYFKCGGHAFDSHLALEAIKKAIEEVIELSKSVKDYANSINELEWLNKQYRNQLDIIEKTDGKSNEWKFEKTLLASWLKKLEELREKQKPKTPVQLKSFMAASNLAFDEVIDYDLKFSVLLTEVETDIAYTKTPVSVSIRWVDTDLNMIVHEETMYTNTVNGIATFRLNPIDLPGYLNITKLRVDYSFTTDNWEKFASENATLKYIKPKVVLLNGSEVPSSLIFTYNKPQSFKLVNEDGRAIPVDYSTLRVTNNTNPKTAINLALKDAHFTLTGSTSSKTAENTNFSISYQNKTLKTIAAEVHPEFDSTELYRAACVGTWTVTHYAETNTTKQLELYANGTGLYVGTNMYVRWRLEKSANNEYRLYEEGYWHSAYNNLSRTKLTYPITGFTTGNNGAISIRYVKN